MEWICFVSFVSSWTLSALLVPQSRFLALMTPKTGVDQLRLLKRDTAGHKCVLSMTDVETEIELILGRVPTSFSSELNLSELMICPLHGSSLGIGLRRGSNLCRGPPPISKHGGKAQKTAKAERGIGKSDCYLYGRKSEFLFQLFQVCNVSWLKFNLWFEFF